MYVTKITALYYIIFLLHIKSEQLIKKYILLITNRLYEILLQKTVRA